MKRKKKIEKINTDCPVYLTNVKLNELVDEINELVDEINRINTEKEAEEERRKVSPF